jgi:hypothetical protein
MRPVGDGLELQETVWDGKPYRLSILLSVIKQAAQEQETHHYNICPHSNGMGYDDQEKEAQRQ